MCNTQIRGDKAIKWPEGRKGAAAGRKKQEGNRREGKEGKKGSGSEGQRGSWHCWLGLKGKLRQERNINSKCSMRLRARMLSKVLLLSRIILHSERCYVINLKIDFIPFSSLPRSLYHPSLHCDATTTTKAAGDSEVSSERGSRTS